LHPSFCFFSSSSSSASVGAMPPLTLAVALLAASIALAQGKSNTKFYNFFLF
jgi:hypothetical protein